MLEHRLVMEGILGRYLGSSEVVHHLNGDPEDNRPANLQVTRQAAHAYDHSLRRLRDAWGRFL